MSTISVSNIETANGSEPLTLKTGNTAAGDIIIGPAGGVTIASNSTVNTFIANATGSHFTGNVNITSLRANAALGTTFQILSANSTGGIFWANNNIPDQTKVTVFTTTGSNTFTKDANCVIAQIICIGAGGGGAGATGTAVANGANAGAGGGGGGVAIKWLTAAQIGATANLVIGTGGAGAANSLNTATSGSNSTFANSTGGLITGQGGAGAAGVTQGAGGAAINGDINIPGGDGGYGWPLGLVASQRSGVSGIGGPSGLGFGDGGAGIIAAAAAGSAGNNGDGYGGGGSGASRANTAASSTGGSGSNGAVIVIEFISG